MPTQIVLEIENCSGCPSHGTKATEGAGYAQDYYCSLLRRKISGYVEWDRDHKPIPDDCPLRLTNIHRMKGAIG